MRSHFDSEQEANAYKDEHQLHGRVAEPLKGTGKWALNFPIEAHLTVVAHENKKMILDEPLFALHRVNRITGEAVRFERGSSPAGPKATIQGLAAGARAMKMAGDGDWEIDVLRDVRAELQVEGVPERIIGIVESMMDGRQWGLCDPMYMSNRVAAKFGWGDGFSNFSSTEETPDQAMINEFAQEIHWSYVTAFGEMNLSAYGVLGRVLGGLAADAQAPVVERPRG